VDWWLLGTLLPVYLAIQVVGVRSYLAHGPWWFPFSVAGAQSPADYPIVDRLNVLDSPVRVGDRLLRVGDSDLRGFSRAEARRAQAPLLRGGHPFRAELERNGERFEAMLAPAPQPYWWWRILGGASLAAAGTFLLLRAPHWHLSRRFFVAQLLVGSWGASDLGQLPVVATLAVSIGLGLTLLNALEWTEATRPLRPWQRALPWALALVMAATNLASRLQSMTRELSASIAIDETTRERAGYVCADFVCHESLAIRGRTGRFDVFALPLRAG